MQISIIAAGTRMPQWVQQCCDDYLRRLPRPFSVREVQVALEKRSSGQSTDKVKQRETLRLLSEVPAGDWLVALDEQGRCCTTAEFASQLASWRDEGRNVSFLIGGPDGIDFSCVSKGRQKWPDQRWSLSPLTFPHPLVRVLLAEQIYRGWSVVAGHPYHRE